MHLYVYYAVDRDVADGLRDRVRAMQASLAVDPARCRLRRRAIPDGGAETWMEVYEDVAPAFETRLAAAVARDGLASSTGPRHVERFVDIA